MPHFELVPVQEAVRQTALNSRRWLMVAEYSGYIRELRDGQAGKLTPSPGETALAVRRRLTAAARQMGRGLVTKRTGDEVYFWLQPPGRGRRGRPPKAT